MPHSYSFISSPYSSGLPSHIKSGSLEAAEIMEARYRATMEFTAWCFQAGRIVFSPIVHCHAMAKHHNLPKDAEWWKAYNEKMLWSADSLYLFPLEGWEQSAGVMMELELAKEIGIKLFRADLDTGREFASKYRMVQFA